MSPLLGLQATAEYFGYSTNWVMAQIRTNGLPAYRVGNSWRFIPTDLETWVRTHPRKIRAISNRHHMYNMHVARTKAYLKPSKRTKVNR